MQYKSTEDILVDVTIIGVRERERRCFFLQKMFYRVTEKTTLCSEKNSIKTQFERNTIGQKEKPTH